MNYVHLSWLEIIANVYFKSSENKSLHVNKYIVCGDVMFWLKYIKKLWPNTDMLLEKEGLF